MALGQGDQVEMGSEAASQQSPHRASVLGTVVPEATGGELLPDDHGEAVDEALADPHDVTWKRKSPRLAWGRPWGHVEDPNVDLGQGMLACGVVERKAVVEDVLWVHPVGVVPKGSDAVIPARTRPRMRTWG